MAKTKEVFACSACGAVHTKWLGKCPDCGTWDSLESQRVETKSKTDPRAAATATFNPDSANASNPARPIAHIDERGPTHARAKTGIAELDRVLGGGLVPGSAILVGGDPGIGKSTLLMQAAGALANSGLRVLYVSSEESAEQVRMRAARLGVADQNSSSTQANNLFVLADTSLARIADQAAKVFGDPDPQGNAPAHKGVLIIDSIQMIYQPALDAFPGSLTQLRRCTAELVFMAKATGTAVIMVGHVTKDGMLAGPRMLEHLVDAVLYFEGDRYHAHRIVRAVKNRFGSTLELGLFEMASSGLREAPAGALVAGAADTPRPGTVVCPILSGSRTLLVEIQALTATGFPGATKRKASGIDANRLAMLIAVLEQHAGLRLADRDVFVSAVGGVKVAEPGADLALLLAIAGAHRRAALQKRSCAAGEVGLAGETRPVANLDARITEAQRLGFETIILPKGARQLLGKNQNINIVEVANIAQALELLSPTSTPTSASTTKSPRD